jgi:hypothetical protein
VATGLDVLLKAVDQTRSLVAQIGQIACDVGQVRFEIAGAVGLAHQALEDDGGTELEFVIMVIAVSCVKLLSAHNSTQHTSRKHKV